MYVFKKYRFLLKRTGLWASKYRFVFPEVGMSAIEPLDSVECCLGAVATNHSPVRDILLLLIELCECVNKVECIGF